MQSPPAYAFAIDSTGHVTMHGVDDLFIPCGAIFTDADSAGHDIYGPFDAASRDLLRVASAVATADRLSPRCPKGRKGLARELCWPRRIDVALALEAPESWRRSAQQLADLLNFLTDDAWAFSFEGGAKAPPEPLPLFPETLSPDSEVVLFSGGLDSACGALLRARALAGSGRSLVAVTAFGQTVSRHRVLDVYRALGHPAVMRWRGFEHQLRVRSVQEDASRRARGFFFLAVAAALARRIGASRVLSFETGVGALSTPMNAAQAGAQNTRSMHPKTVALCEALFRGTLDGPISLEQPYFFLTKGELCRAAGDALQDLAVKSITCDGGGQHQPLSGAHCGFCTSCLYRRSSLHAALRGRDPTPYRAPPKSRNSGYPVFAFENQSIELSRAALSWPDLLAYDSNIRHAVARFAQVGVRTQAEVQTALCDLFRRHAGEALACLREDPPLRVRAPSTVGAAS